MNLPTLLHSYSLRVETTDNLPLDTIRPVLFGLFGEVGSVLATSKKRVREKALFPQYEQSLVEEFGDALWYFAALCRRTRFGIESVAAGFGEPDREPSTSSADDTAALAALATTAGELLSIQDGESASAASLQCFLGSFLAAVRATGVELGEIARRNEDKVRGRFLRTAPADLPDFDSSFPEDEQLPRRFEIAILRRGRQARLRWNGVFIGDTLTDNVQDPDHYRFHDVFHLAHAAILHWSPVVRALIRQKRKSVQSVDENEDGGRAIVVEEGVTAWIFAQAKQASYFEGCERVSFGLLKTVHEFVQEFEVAQCPLELWERAILQGYSVFRDVRASDGGIVIGNRDDRTIAFRGH